MSETQLKSALLMIIKTFRQYGVRNDDTWVLTQSGFTQLMTAQMPNFSKILGLGPTQEIIEATCQNNADKVFEEYDTNHDAQLSFEEFTKFLSKILIDMFWDILKDPEGGQDASSANPGP